jgi:glycosyltransferase involved in cell wall biosynthesis
MRKEAVAVGIIVWNGVNNISAMLDSLLNQSYKDVRIYILDNQSTDGTKDVLSFYASQDSRIEFYVDTQKRDIAQAQKKIFDRFLIQHEFCMFSCDDDLYQENYIEHTLHELQTNDLDLVYTNFKYISDSGQVTQAKNNPLYCKNYTSYQNARNFLFFRNCIPIFFGIYKTASLKNSMPYFKLVDKYGFNHENLMLFHFLLKGKVGYLESQHFIYRLKERVNLYKSRGYFFSTFGLKKYYYTLLHNLNVSVELGRIIASSDLSRAKSVVMFGILPMAYFHKTFYSLFIYPLIRKLINFKNAP